MQRAKVWFRETYGLYCGAVLDTLFDHFLANDPSLFPSQESLLQFTQDTYNKLEKNRQYLAAPFLAYFPHMKEHNWLLGYRNLLGVQRSLKGLERRAKYIPSTDKAYQLFIRHYYELNQCYFEFIDDVIKFVKIELTE
jgi:acyl carrier protein phosphodiesterase